MAASQHYTSGTTALDSSGGSPPHNVGFRQQPSWTTE